MSDFKYAAALGIIDKTPVNVWAACRNSTGTPVEILIKSLDATIPICAKDAILEDSNCFALRWGDFDRPNGSAGITCCIGKFIDNLIIGSNTG